MGWMSLLLLLMGSVTALAPGDTAPAFALAATDGTTVRLGDFAGKRTVVLAFFPKAFTSG